MILGTIRGLLSKTLAEAGIDEGEGRTEELNGALRFFANHTAATATYSTTVGSSGVVGLPDDVLQIRAIHYPEGPYYIEQLSIIPGKSFAGKGWYEWPTGTLRFVDVVGRVDVEYYAYYRTIRTADDDSALVRIPKWALYPIVLLAAYYCMVPESVTASQLGQWDSTIDSGNPEHNPLMKQARFFWERYTIEVDQWPRQQRTLPQHHGVM